MPLLQRRAYDNTNRAAQSLATRERIVEQMIAALADGEEDISVEKLARAAGVSRRTVYQHFPDKRARIEAMDAWIKTQVGDPNLTPEGIHDIPDYVSRTVDYILDNPKLAAAQMAPGLSKRLRQRRKRRIFEGLQNTFLDAGFTKPDSLNLAATIVTTLRAEAIMDLADVYQMPRERIKQNLTKMVLGLVQKHR